MKNPFEDEVYLVTRCIAGDVHAQKFLYEVHRSKIMGILRRYTSSHQDAQDIFQESFVTIFSTLKTLKHQNNMEAWMKTIAIRTAINHYHRDKKNLALVPVEHEVLEDESFEKIVEDIDIHHLLEIINTLPDGARMVFNLYVVEGYSHSEIAELLSINEGTSKSQLNRAKELIKIKLHRLGITNYTKYA